MPGETFGAALRLALYLTLSNPHQSWTRQLLPKRAESIVREFCENKDLKVRWFEGREDGSLHNMIPAGNIHTV